MRSPRTRVVKPAVSGWWVDRGPLHMFGDVVKWKTELGPFSVSEEESYHDTMFPERSPSKNVKGIGIKSSTLQALTASGEQRRGNSVSVSLPRAIEWMSNHRNGSE